MDELFVLAAVLGLLALLVAGPVIGWIALWRIRELGRRIAELEARGAPDRASAAADAPPPATRPPAPYSTVPRPAPSTLSTPEPSTLATPAPSTVSRPAPPGLEHPAPSFVPPVPATPGRDPAPTSAPPRPPAEPPPLPFEKREPARPRIEWEQWVGVRGAAVLGGCVLALAAIFLVKHSIERGWITPAMRCWLGAASGVAAILAGARLRVRGVRVVPNALDGAGVVALFASVWAAHRVWGFFSAWVALALLAAVTALACVLAIRHRSQLTAVLGLVGGFAAAFLLSEHGERPLGTFGYLLLLDLGLLFVGRRGGWPSLGVLALAGTFLYEALYVFRDLDPERTLFALGILATFALVFALANGVRRGARASSPGWFASQAGAVLLPFVFALRFAGTSGFQDHIGATFGLVAILGSAACVLARVQGAPWLAVGAAAAGVAVVAEWAIEVSAAGSAPWMLVALTGGLVLLYHVFGELDAGRAAGAGARAAAIAAAGALLLFVAAPLFGGRTSALAWTIGLAVPAAALVRQGSFRGHAPLIPVAGALAGLGVMVHGLHRIVDSDGSGGPGGPGGPVGLLPAPAFPALTTVALALALGGVALHVAAFLHRERARTLARHAVGLFVVPGLLGLLPHVDDAPIVGVQLAVLVPAALLALAAALLGSGVWIAAGALAAAGLHILIASLDGTPLPGAALPGVVVGMLLFAALPLAVAARAGASAATEQPVRTRRAFWVVAALSVAPLYPLAHFLYVERFSDGVEALPLVVAAALVGALGLGAARVLAPTTPSSAYQAGRAAQAARAAYGAVAVVLLAGALPVQLDFEVAPVWLALIALGFAGLAVRLNARALAVLAPVPALLATAYLVLYALVPYHYERSAVPVASWLSYAHLVPIAALLLGAWLLRRAGTNAEAALLGFCAAALGFVWINVSILDVFAEPGTRIALRLERDQARDLTMSIAWAAYAFALLVAGTGLRAGPLRWTSLMLFLLTIAKVFLFDLGKLDGLHRVASLAGLALTLIAVSLLYQRFVFRRRPEPSQP